MKKIIFSFGNRPYYGKLQKLKKSIEEKSPVDKIITFNESDIDPGFFQENSRHFKDNRGFGYWVWKSYFIKKLLESAGPDDVFLYLDSGILVVGDLNPLFEICSQDPKGIILFENTYCQGICRNNNWTKSDCFNLMGLKTPEYVLGNQIDAAFILFRKNEFSEQFFDLFYNFCKNYNIISDAPNITENFNKDFRDHRHDQSILSLLSIQHKITILRSPSQTGNSRMKKEDKYGQVLNHYRR